MVKYRVAVPVMVMCLSSTLALSGCSKKFVCDLCGQEKTGKQYQFQEYDMNMTICEECNSRINFLSGSLEEDMNALLGNF